MVHSLGQHQMECKSFHSQENAPATLENVLTKVGVVFLKEGKSYEELKRELGDVASPVSVAAVVSVHTIDFRNLTIVP